MLWGVRGGAEVSEVLKGMLLKLCISRGKSVNGEKRGDIGYTFNNKDTILNLWVQELTPKGGVHGPLCLHGLDYCLRDVFLPM